MKSRILIVDDEPICTQFLSLTLEEEGFDVRAASNADEAIRLGQSFEPNLVITDWMLKDSKDGMQVVQQLASALPDMRVIFITGMARDIIRSQLGETRCDGIVIKPVDLDEMIGMVRKLL